MDKNEANTAKRWETRLANLKNAVTNVQAVAENKTKDSSHTQRITKETERIGRNQQEEQRVIQSITFTNNHAKKPRIIKIMVKGKKKSILKRWKMKLQGQYS